MYTLEQAEELQRDFAYIIEKERRTGMETGRDTVTLFFGHGGTIKEHYRDKSIIATMPTDSKYLALKAKYFSVNTISIFYPKEFENRLDNSDKF